MAYNFSRFLSIMLMVTHHSCHKSQPGSFIYSPYWTKENFTPRRFNQSLSVLSNYDVCHDINVVLEIFPFNHLQRLTATASFGSLVWPFPSSLRRRQHLSFFQNSAQIESAWVEFHAKYCKCKTKYLDTISMGLSCHWANSSLGAVTWKLPENQPRPEQIHLEITWKSPENQPWKSSPDLLEACPGGSHRQLPIGFPPCGWELRFRKILHWNILGEYLWVRSKI